MASTTATIKPWLLSLALSKTENKDDDQASWLVVTLRVVRRRALIKKHNFHLLEDGSDSSHINDVDNYCYNCCLTSPLAVLFLTAHLFSNTHDEVKRNPLFVLSATLFHQNKLIERDSSHLNLPML